MVLADLDAGRVRRWRRRWDEVMNRYLPGITGLEEAIAGATEAVGAGPPGVVIDLGGGPGLFAERLARRWPHADLRLLDLDPALLALARAGLPAGLVVRQADLGDPAWLAQVDGDGPADLITVIMTMHYLPEDRVLTLYREIREVLRPGGLLVVADCMHDRGLPSVMNPLHPVADEAMAGIAWSRWWDEIATEPALGPALRQRRELFSRRPPAEFTPDAQWHGAAARAAGFRETGVIWRQGAHAALCAVA